MAPQVHPLVDRIIDARLANKTPAAAADLVVRLGNEGLWSDPEEVHNAILRLRVTRSLSSSWLDDLATYIGHAQADSIPRWWMA